MSKTKISYQQLLKAVMIATIGVIALGIIRGQSSLTLYWQLKKSQGILENAVNALKQENALLSEEIIKLKESPDYAKKILKDKYHITEPDEDIVYFAE